MKTLQDAYGRELYSLYRGEESYEIVERDDGYIDAGPGGAYLAPYRDWPVHQKKAMRCVRGKVLDIGCGAGRHALHLQERSHDVLGIDISPLAVKTCKLRGLKKARAMSVTRVSAKLGTFDTILMMGNNLGLLGNPTRAKWLLRKFHRITGEGGRIVAETLDPYQTTNPDHLAYHKRNRKRGRMPGQLKIRIRFQKYTGPWFEYLFVSRDELAELLEGAGWQVRRFIDSKSAIYIAVIDKSPAGEPDQKRRARP